MAAGERPSCSTPPPANEEDDDEASSSSSPDASYTSPTPRLRKQLQQCRTALSLAEGRTLASTRGAAQSKMDLEDMSRKQRYSQVHIAALRDEVRTAERDATDAAAARDEAHGKLGTSSTATRLALGRFRERLGQLEGDMAQRSARNQQHLQQLALLVAEIQHEVGGRGGPAAAPPRTRSLLRQMQQCLSFAAQDAALPAAAAWTHTAGEALIGSSRVQEVAATQASPPRRQASPPRRSRQASPPRRSGQASPQRRSKQASPPLRSRSAPVSSPSRRHASPSARAKLLSRLSAEGRPQQAAAAPTASQEDLAAATEDVVAATCLALGLPAPPLGPTAPPGVASSVARAAAGTAAASASALAGAKAEAEAAAVSAAFAEEEVAAQRRKAEAAEEAGLRLALELEAAQVQLREAGGQEARQEERAQEAEGLVGRYQQHIMRLQAAQATREEEVGPRERRGCNPMRGRLRPYAW